MASLVDWLFFSGARDSDGTPLSSGSISFYTPGSTSESVVAYADAAGTTPLTQPVALDAAGRAEVYLNAQAEIVVRNAAGAARRTSVNAKSLGALQVPVTWQSAPSTLQAALAAIDTFVTNANSAAPHSTAHSEGIATASPSFEFDPTKTVNVFVASYGAAVGAITIGWPAGLPYIAANTLFLISIQTTAGTTATSTVFDSHIRKITPPTTWAGGKQLFAFFISPPYSDNGGIDQITPWFGNV